jgi:hypothetical protein
VGGRILTPPPPEALCCTFIEISVQAKRTARACLAQALSGATAQGAPGSRASPAKSEVAEAPGPRHGGGLKLCVSSDAAAAGFAARAVVRALHTRDAGPLTLELLVLLTRGRARAGLLPRGNSALL